MAPINPSSDPSKEVYNHGMALDPENKRVQCCHCGKIVSGFNRLQHHLGGIRGNIVECPGVPDDVKEFFRQSLLSAKVCRLVKEVGDFHHPAPPLKRSCTSNGKVNGVKLQGHNWNLPTSTARSSVRELTSNRNGGRPASEKASSCKEGQDSASIMSKRHIGRFFFENVVDYSAVSSQSFRGMIGISLKSGEITRSIPSIAELKGWILDDELSDVQSYVNEVRLSWARNGCSILLDGWTDQSGRSLINIIVDSLMGPIYLRSADVSPSTKGGANALQLLLESVLEEVGVQNVVQIIAHTSSDSMEAVSKQLIDKYRSLFWNVSTSHCISLMLDKIAVTGSIKPTLDKAKTITRFIYNRVAVLQLLRRHISTHDLVKPSKIKAASCFMTLEAFLVEKSNLEIMFISSEWLNSSWASSVEGVKVANLIGDNSFWDGVIIAVKASIPLVRAISLINKDCEPNMGFIYETMDQVKETISEEYRGRKSQYTPFWNIIDEIWNTVLHSPIHAAGYFLNPRLHYTEDFYSDSEVAGGLLVTIVRLVEDQRAQDLISQQLDVYGNCRGEFKLGTENDSQFNLSPAAWWSRYGGHCPDLQKVAVRVLSQTCKGAEAYGLRRDLAEKLRSRSRNSIEQQRLHDLAYVHYNLKLKQFKMGEKFNIQGDEIDPTDDWIVDEPDLAESESGVHTSVSGSTVQEERPSGAQPKMETKREP